MERKRNGETAVLGEEKVEGEEGDERRVEKVEGERTNNEEEEGKKVAKEEENVEGAG